MFEGTDSVFILKAKIAFAYRAKTTMALKKAE